MLNTFAPYPQAGSYGYLKACGTKVRIIQNCGKTDVLTADFSDRASGTRRVPLSAIQQGQPVPPKIRRTPAEMADAVDCV